MPLSLRSLDSPLRQAERTLRRPSSAVWLQSVTVRTTRFDDALAFYVNLIGLTLGGVEVHPLTAQPRARMLDGEGRDVFELIETEGNPVTGTHELSFGMPRRTVTLLRSRLDLQDVPYTDAGRTLLLSDIDGTTLRIIAL